MRKTLVIVGIIVAALAIAVWLFLSNLNALVKAAIEKYGSEITQVSVDVGEVDISANSGEGRLQQLTVGNPAGFDSDYAFALGETAIKLDVQSVTTDTVIIEALDIIDPAISVEQTQAGNNVWIIQQNIQASLAARQGNDDAADDEAQVIADDSGKSFIVESLLIQGAKLHIHSPLLAQGVITVPLDDIQINNIGQDGQGVSANEVLEVVMQRLSAQINDAIAERGLESMIDMSPESLLQDEGGFTDRIRSFFSR